MSDYTRLVYIAGPFRAKPDPTNQWVQEQNIREAEALALEVWKLGAVAVCPHLNTRYFQGALPDAAWLDGDLTLMKRCDAVLMTPRWLESDGARVERDEALEHGISVFYVLSSLGWWLSEGRTASFSLGQSWVAQVTTADGPEVSVIGADVVPTPKKGEV